MPATADLSLSIRGDLIKPIDLKTGLAPLSYIPLFTFTDGEGANQIQQIFTDSRTLLSAASENLDLSGSLRNIYNELINFTKIRLFLIRCPSTNPNVVRVGPGAANGWVTAFNDASDRINIRPGGILIMVSADPTGYAVTAGSGDIVTVLNTNDAAAVSVAYEIVLMGTGTVTSP